MKCVPCSITASLGADSSVSVQVPDFSPLYGSERFADVELLLREEQEADSSGPGESLLLPCHAVVLTAFSPYFNTKLDNWDTAPDAITRTPARVSRAHDSPGQHSKAQDSCSAQDSKAQDSCPARRHHIQMPVPAGQLAVGQLLVRGMYAAVPDLSGISQCQLTQLLLLADRYEVAKVVAAAAATVHAIPSKDISWDTVTAVYSLPPGAAELPACRSLFDAAGAKLQLELGDLELAWGDSARQRALLDLPCAGLQQLLCDYATRVGSECTVLYTIERWYQHQQQLLPLEQQPSAEQLRELVSLVRMQHCGKTYVTSVFANGQVAERALTRQELAAACAVAEAEKTSSASRPGIAAHWQWPVLVDLKAWTQKPRLATARAAALEWSIPATDLKRVYEGYAVAGAGFLQSPLALYGGVQCHLVFGVGHDRASRAQGGELSTMEAWVYVKMPKLPEEGVCHLDWEVMSCLDGGEYVSCFRPAGGHRRATPLEAAAGEDFPNFVSALRALNLVKPDGSMQLRLLIHGIE